MSTGAGGLAGSLSMENIHFPGTVCLNPGRKNLAFPPKVSVEFALSGYFR